MENLMSMLPAIKSILILDSDGQRVAAKYYDPEYATLTAQTDYEKTLFQKTGKTTPRSEAEICVFNKMITVFRLCNDAFIYVTGQHEENEVILMTLLNAFVDCLTSLTRDISKKSLLDNLDQVYLALDEMIDDGIILEMDSAAIVSRVSMRGTEGEVPLHEQSLSKAIGSVKDQLARSLLK